MSFGVGVRGARGHVNGRSDVRMCLVSSRCIPNARIGHQRPSSLMVEVAPSAGRKIFSGEKALDWSVAREEGLGSSPTPSLSNLMKSF